MDTVTPGDFALNLDSISTELLELLRTEEERLLIEKEFLLVVYEGATGSRQLRRRAVELSRLHTEGFIQELLPVVVSALV
jgi:hypothetical protein